MLDHVACWSTSFSRWGTLVETSRPAPKGATAPADRPPAERCEGFISQKVFLKSFCKSQLPYKSVNSFFLEGMVKDKLTDFGGS